MARYRYHGSNSNGGSRKKRSLQSIFLYTILPVFGFVGCVLIFLAYKGYLSTKVLTK